jgi:hypothetical protein
MLSKDALEIGLEQEKYFKFLPSLPYYVFIAEISLVIVFAFFDSNRGATIGDTEIYGVFLTSPFFNWFLIILVGGLLSLMHATYLMIRLSSDIITASNNLYHLNKEYLNHNKATEDSSSVKSSSTITINQRELTIPEKDLSTWRCDCGFLNKNVANECLGCFKKRINVEPTAK